jgi:hypothetical protein
MPKLRLNVLFIFIKMYTVSIKCLIFTLIIVFYLFFGQNTDGKELTIDEDNISKVRFSNFVNSIIFYKVSVKIRYACVTSLNSQKILFLKILNLTPVPFKKNQFSLLTSK